MFVILQQIYEVNENKRKWRAADTVNTAKEVSYYDGEILDVLIIIICNYKATVYS